VRDPRKRIARGLLRFGEKLRYRAPAEPTAASRFVDSDWNAWLFGVIFDQGVLAENAWEAPYLLRRRLGHFSMRRMAEMSVTELRDAVKHTRSQKALHRFTKSMPRWLKSAACWLVSEYRGRAEAIWADCRTAAEVIARLDEFDGIGSKKAHMAAAILRDSGELAGRDFEAINVAVDVHVCRVWKRLGLVKSSNVREIHAVASELHPKYPGALDSPTWTVGRDWCHAHEPDCSGDGVGKPCPLQKQCRIGSRR